MFPAGLNAPWGRQLRRTFWFSIGQWVLTCILSGRLSSPYGDVHWHSTICPATSVLIQMDKSTQGYSTLDPLTYSVKHGSLLVRPYTHVSSVTCTYIGGQVDQSSLSNFATSMPPLQSASTIQSKIVTQCEMIEQLQEPCAFEEYTEEDSCTTSWKPLTKDFTLQSLLSENTQDAKAHYGLRIGGLSTLMPTGSYLTNTW